MSVDKQVLGDFTADIYHQNSLSDFFRVYNKYVQTLGFDGVAYTFLPELSLEKNIQRAPVFMSSELFPNRFIEHYTQDRLDHHDFTIKRIKAKKMTPMDWQVFARSDRLTQEEKTTITIAHCDYDIKNAISIPTMSEDSGVAGASIISTETNANFEKLKKERLETLLICTKLFHDATVNLSRSSLADTFVMPLLTDMKPKEIIILRYFASGNSLKNIYDSTGISYSYASNLLSALRQRFGGISNEKLMYIIGLFGILDRL